MSWDRTEANFGRDDGIKCYECGGTTFLSFDQGGGLISYDCETEGCDAVTQVQYDEPFNEDDEDDEPDPEYYEPPFDMEEVW